MTWVIIGRARSAWGFGGTGPDGSTWNVRARDDDVPSTRRERAGVNFDQAAVHVADAGEHGAEPGAPADAVLGEGRAAQVGLDRDHAQVERGQRARRAERDAGLALAGPGGGDHDRLELRPELEEAQVRGERAVALELAAVLAGHDRLRPPRGPRDGGKDRQPERVLDVLLVLQPAVDELHRDGDRDGEAEAEDEREDPVEHRLRFRRLRGHVGGLGNLDAAALSGREDLDLPELRSQIAPLFAGLLLGAELVELAAGDRLRLR